MAGVDAFTVCLLAMDKEEGNMYKLLKFNVSNGDERLITEIPYRKNCAIAFLKGTIYNQVLAAFISISSDLPRLLGVLAKSRP